MSGSSKRKFSSDDDDALRELVSSMLSGRYQEDTYLWDVSSVCKARPESAPRLLALIDRYKRIGRMPASQHAKVKARIDQVMTANKPASPKHSSAHLVAVNEEDIDGIDIDVEPLEEDSADDLSEDSMTREFRAPSPAESIRAKIASNVRAVARPSAAPSVAATVAPAPPRAQPTARPAQPARPQPTIIPAADPVQPSAPAPIAPPAIAPLAIAPAPVLAPVDITSAATRVMSAPPPAPSVDQSEVPAAVAALAGTDTPVGLTIGLNTVLHDRYELRQLLGRGGIATVYKAVDRYRVSLGLEDCYVAVKIVQPHPSRPGSVAALGREFHNAQLLSHPNVINVFNIDHVGDASYYTMEPLDGERLSQLMKRVGVLPRRYALAIIRDIGAAIAHAHSRGVVHADLKPHNIMITRTGQVRVLDFGSGLIRAREPWISEMSPDEDYRQATPAYASCEQLEGWSADPRDDIYALACLAYQLLAGRHPFDMQPSLDARARRRQPKRPPNLKGESWRALRRGLAWTREQRSMAVEDWLKELGVSAAAETLPPLSSLQAAKPPRVRLRGLAAAALLVTGLGLAAFTVQQQRSTDWQPTWLKAQGTLNDAWKGFQSFVGDSTASAAIAEPAIVATPSVAVPAAPAAQAPQATRRSSSLASRASAPLARSSHAADAEKVAMVSPMASPVAAQDTSDATGGIPPAAANSAIGPVPPLQFSAASYIVPGTEPAARIVIRRNGSTDGDVDFVWWTEEGSAKADVDYASLGRRVERIPSGSDKITVYVPIISNSQRHDLKQFYVALSAPGSFRSTGPGTRSLVTIDHGT